jgi:hypothetical protein
MFEGLIKESEVRMNPKILKAILSTKGGPAAFNRAAVGAGEKAMNKGRFGRVLHDVARSTKRNFTRATDEVGYRTRKAGRLVRDTGENALAEANFFRKQNPKTFYGGIGGAAVAGGLGGAILHNRRRADNLGPETAL